MYPPKKLLFKEKYFKEQLRNYMYLIVKRKAKSKKQKQMTNHLLSKKIKLPPLKYL